MRHAFDFNLAALFSARIVSSQDMTEGASDDETEFAKLPARELSLHDILMLNNGELKREISVRGQAPTGKTKPELQVQLITLTAKSRPVVAPSPNAQSSVRSPSRDADNTRVGTPQKSLSRNSTVRLEDASIPPEILLKLKQLENEQMQIPREKEKEQMQMQQNSTWPGKGYILILTGKD